MRESGPRGHMAARFILLKNQRLFNKKGLCDNQRLTVIFLNPDSEKPVWSMAGP
jgi:hypothetical protein